MEASPKNRKWCVRASGPGFFCLLGLTVVLCLWNYQEVTYFLAPNNCSDGLHQCPTTFLRVPVAPVAFNETSRTKRILFWVPFFSRPDYYVGFGREPFAECPVSDCETTANRSLLYDSDAILFHFRDTKYSDLPRWRSPTQRWVFFLLESPSNTNPDLRPFNGLFNWTMTYRRDSDVTSPYASVQPLGESTTRRPKKKKRVKKRRLVSWLVSNCDTDGHREDYVDELRDHIAVDIYGKCYGRLCDATVSCQEALLRGYKFYLSFENSICRDYVTEKFYKVLDYDTVPVVYGGADYSQVAPPHSYVDVRDFKSPRHLAEFLLKLDGNDTLYREYFRWKSNYRIEAGLNRPFCDLCAKLHNVNSENKVYGDIYSWWHTQGNCVSDIYAASGKSGEVNDQS